MEETRKTLGESIDELQNNIDGLWAELGKACSATEHFRLYLKTALVRSRLREARRKDYRIAAWVGLAAVMLVAGAVCGFMFM